MNLGRLLINFRRRWLFSDGEEVNGMVWTPKGQREADGFQKKMTNPKNYQWMFTPVFLIDQRKPANQDKVIHSILC